MLLHAFTEVDRLVLVDWDKFITLLKKNFVSLSNDRDFGTILIFNDQITQLIRFHRDGPRLEYNILRLLVLVQSKKGFVLLDHHRTVRLHQHGCTRAVTVLYQHAALII